MIINRFYNFLNSIKIRNKLFIALLVYSLIISIIISTIIYNISFNKFYKIFLDQKYTLVKSLSWAIEPDVYAGFLHPDMKNDPEYENYQKQISKILLDEPVIVYLYGVYLNKKDNQLYYALDGSISQSDMLLVESEDFKFTFYLHDNITPVVKYNNSIHKDSFSIEINHKLYQFTINREPYIELILNGESLVKLLPDIVPKFKLNDGKQIGEDVTHKEINIKSIEEKIYLTYIKKNNYIYSPGSYFHESSIFKKKIFNSMKKCKMYSSDEKEQSAIGEFIHLIIPLQGSENECSGAIVMSLSPEIITDFRLSNITGIVSISILLFLFSLGVSYILSGLILFPLYKLTNAVLDLSNGNMDSIVRIKSGDEFGFLAKNFNEMVNNLKHAYEENASLALIRNELQIARQIQESILPKQVPSINGLELSVVYKPMAMVGGDFYDFHTVGKDEVGIFLADVAGHGVPAAIIAAMLKIAFSIQNVKEKNPAKILENINSIMIDKSGTHFITGCYLRINNKTKIATLSKAGHPPLFHYSYKTKKVTLHELKGRLIGVFDKLNCTATKIKFEKNDRFIILTDGFLEVMNDKEELFGEENMVQFLEKYGHITSNLFNDLLLETLKSWKSDAISKEFEDDLTLILIDVVK
jgi:serine phosphatase RsbU (regulator of sigma subunit)